MSQIEVYQSRRTKGLLGVVLCAAFALAGSWMITTRPLLGWVSVIFFAGLGGIGLVGVLTGGSQLRVGRKGFEIASAFNCTRYRWDEIEAPTIAHIRRTAVIAINYLPGRRPPGLSRALTGLDAAIGNVYGMPLQELCDKLNKRRSEHLASVAPGAAPASRVVETDPPPGGGFDAPAVGEAKPVRAGLLACGAAILALVLNALLRLVLKLDGMPLTMGIAFGVGGLCMLWFLKFAGRAPSTGERSRFLWTYSLLVVLPTLAVFAVASALRGFNAFALVIFALHALAYPAAAQFFLADKRFAVLRR